MVLGQVSPSDLHLKVMCGNRTTIVKRLPFEGQECSKLRTVFWPFKRLWLKRDDFLMTKHEPSIHSLNTDRLAMMSLFASS